METYPTYDFVVGGLKPVLGNVRRMDEYREQHVFFRSSEAQGYWVMTRGDHIREALQNPAVFSSTSTMVTDPDPAYLWIPQMLDPPRHTAWRHHLGPYFSPGALARLDDTVQQRCVKLVEPIAEKRSCDFIAEFSSRFPTSIFMDIFGLPMAELDQFLVWENQILHSTPDDDPDHSILMTAMIEVMAYFDELIATRRKDPRDDLLSQSLEWEIDGAPIPDDELLSFCLLMFMAGLDTVTIALDYAFWHLATHPGDRRRIATEPDLVPVAIEELLRVYSFVPPGRKVMQDIDFHGCPMKQGDMVYLSMFSACRDPRWFEHADQVVLDRKPNPHIAFGAGPHRCLGATLARREMRVALEEWHRRIPDYRLPEGFEVQEHGAMFGIKELSFEW